MSAFIDERERIVTIEDSAELQLQQEHVVRLETRPANIEGKGEITQRDLVKNALRMRPDRIIVGEVRAGEAFDMLQAMNTGHDGSMTTVHANTPRDALSRVEQMIGMSGIDIPPRSARAQIASAIHVVIQVARLADGRRKLVSLSEITGMEGDVITMQEIFRFRQTGVSAEGHRPGPVRGHRHPAALPRPGHGPRHHPVGRPVPARREVRSMNDAWLRALVLVCVFARGGARGRGSRPLARAQPRRRQGDQPAAQDDRPRPEPRRDDEHRCGARRRAVPDGLPAWLAAHRAARSSGC